MNLSNHFFNAMRDITSFVITIRVIHIVINILESYGNLLNNEIGVEFEYPKYNLIYMCPNISKDND